MSGAVKAVIDGKMGVNRAADQYGIPRSTLKDRVSAKHSAKSGPQPYLSYEEEEELVAYLVKCAEIGYPKTKDEVIGIVRQALHKKRGARVSDPFQPFDNHISTKEISDFTMGSSDFPECYEDMRIQEVTLLGDSDKDSIVSDVIEPSTLSPMTPIVAVSTRPEKSTISKTVTHKYQIASTCGASTEVTGTPPTCTTSALSMSSDPSIMPAFITSLNSSHVSCGKEGYFLMFITCRSCVYV